ncbi:MAG: pantoate--beta-alanine ligase [Thermodesulfobacteriota bacterium]
MRIINRINEMQQISNEFKLSGKTISFVPTMGALHEGHLGLMKEGRKLANVLVASIFVNPSQFGHNEDYESYIRDLENDSSMMKSVGVDFAFVPSSADMYPEGFQTLVAVEELQKHLCGKFRPGHFNGVSTVVLKLFNIVKPDFAIFGYKDYQQLLIIRKVVEDLNLDIKVVAHEIVREDDGLAMSTRNKYLNESQRQKANKIYFALKSMKELFLNGETNIDIIIKNGKGILEKSGLDEIDYLEILDSISLKPKDIAGIGDLVAVAARIGSARLIDNIIL